MTDPQHATAALINVMAALRHSETGCPWDREQSFETIAPYTIEEAYEVQSAIAAGDPAQLKDELGDLLFQVVYHARLAEEKNWFTFADVAQTITNKMIARHPHVFAAAESRDAAAQTAAWETQKAAERAARHETGILAGIAATIPALAKAQKLTARAARIGFDWPNADAVLDKLAEETAELRAELPTANQARIADELGDMLFVLANLARKLGANAESCLSAANEKFTRRFTHIESALAEAGQTPHEASLETMESLWTAAKEAGL
jgi:ATP diphosphatase